MKKLFGFILSLSCITICAQDEMADNTPVKQAVTELFARFTVKQIKEE